MGYWRIVRDIDPETSSEDISSLIGAYNAPQALQLQYWISASGLGLATFSMSVNWVDLDGVTRSIPGNALGVIDLGALFFSPATFMLRLSDESPVNLVSTLTGVLLGSPKVSYALLLSSGSPEGMVAF